jgi:hypothetical protein
LKFLPYSSIHSAQAAAICGVLAEVPEPSISKPLVVRNFIQATFGV